jgi:ABC-type dipeptide/oligopeptide/nickel transport system permease subunit
MAVAQQTQAYIGVGADAWTLPEQKPLAVRIARPWLQNPAGLFGLFIASIFFVVGLTQMVAQLENVCVPGVACLSNPAYRDYLAPYNPDKTDAAAKHASPSLDHPFGTDKFGKDMLSRMLDGAGRSFMFGLIVLVLGFVPGTALGIISGYAGRWIDYAIQRSAEAWTAFPQLPILLTVRAAVGPGLTAIVIVVALGALFSGSRVLRAIALVEKHKDYVLSARSLGATETHVLMRHVLPNIMPYILVGLSSVFAVAILAEAGLSFLGLIGETGTPRWGTDLSRGLQEGTEYPYLVIFPGLVISIVILAFNLMGDTLRDILDPRLRGSQATGKH